MNIDYFTSRFLSVLMNEKDDESFVFMKLVLGGTTSSRIGKLLNFAVSCMDVNECYLEVGVYTGATLCSAAMNNHRTCIGIDNFDPEMIAGITLFTPAQVKERCLTNIRPFDPYVCFIEADFRKVTRTDISKPVAVSFIDGKHTEDEVKENLKWLVPFLADEAVLVFDDVNSRGVSKAIFDFLKEKPGVELIFHAEPRYLPDAWSASDRFLNNGVSIVAYHRYP